MRITFSLVIGILLVSCSGKPESETKQEVGANHADLKSGEQGAVNSNAAVSSERVAELEALGKAIECTNFDVCLGAVEALGKIGAPAAPLVPRLLKLPARLTKEVAERKKTIAAKWNPYPIPPTDSQMLRDLDDKASDIVLAGMLTMKEIGAAGVPAIASSLENSEEAEYAAIVLAGLGPSAEGAIPALIKKLDDESVNRYCIIALGNIGPRAQSTIPILLQKLEAIQNIPEPYTSSIMNDVTLLSKRRGDSVVIVDALGKIATDSESLALALLKYLDSENYDLRRQCLVVIGRMGSRGAIALPKLIEKIGSNARCSPCPELIETIGDIGPSAKTAIPALIQMLSYDESSVDADAIRRNAAVALRKIQE
jgi:HEAT repeat protein